MNYSSTFDPRTFVLGQLDRVRVKKKGRNDILIICPYHADSHPSGRVHVGSNKGIPIGTFHCFSCGAHGSWDRLAETLNLEKFPAAYKDDLAQRLKAKLNWMHTHVLSYKLPAGLEPWTLEWRGLPMEFLETVPAYRHWDVISSAYRILFPVQVRRSVVGHIGAAIDGDTNPKYRNSEGEWAKDSLFPYQLNQGNTAVLVEGPYDALKLQYEGINGQCYIGVNNFAKENVALLNGDGISNIIALGDGDTQGYEINRKILEVAKDMMHVTVADLPYVKEKKDRIDPGNMPPKIVNELLELYNQISEGKRVKYIKFSLTKEPEIKTC